MIANAAILHVDDDPATTRLVGSLLTERGFKTTPLHDPAQALDRLLHDRHRVVLLDVDMPNVNGIDLLTQIKRLDGGISVIMLTGIVSQGTVLQSMRRGASACFFKPLTDVEPLVEAIRAVFADHERWWATLRELADRRRGEAAAFQAFENEITASAESVASP